MDEKEALEIAIGMLSDQHQNARFGAWPEEEKLAQAIAVMEKLKEEIGTARDEAEGKFPPRGGAS